MASQLGINGLTVKGLRVKYAALEALHGVDLVVPAAGVTVLAGANGAGKTTLLNTIAGLLRPAEGTLESVDDQGDRIDLAALAVPDRVRAGITLVPDGNGVFGRLTVAENLDLFAGPGGDPVPALGLFPELAAFPNRRAGTLSGGEQQMLALARAALTPWRLLLVDELSHGLAPPIAARCYAALAEMAASGADSARPGGAARAVVLAEPHVRNGLELADRVVVLRRGEVAFAGSRDEATAAAIDAAMA